MERKNKLAEMLLDAIFSKQNNFSADDDATHLNCQRCFKKIIDYIDWLNQIDVNTVLVYSHPSIESLCLCYALVISNKTYIPIHTSTSSELIKTYLKNYQVDLLWVQPELRQNMADDLQNLLIEDEHLQFLYYISQVQQKKFCLLPGMILFTSGTTAQPKAVHYHYNTLSSYLTWCLEEFQFTEEDNFLFTSELSFVASLRALFLPMFSGIHLRFLGNNCKNKLQSITTILQQQRITILSLTPTFFKTLLRHIEQHKFLASLSSVRLILLSGESIDVSVFNHWYQHIKNDTLFYNLYGATEFLVPFFKKITGPLSETEQFHLGQLRNGCDYRIVPDAAMGNELCIAGDIATAYLDLELSRTHEIILDNQRFIKSGDLVTQMNGQLFFCSRSTRSIKQYGQLINLDQIELVLKNVFNESLDFIALFVENNIVLMIHGTSPNNEIIPRIQEHLSQHLPKYMHPNEYRFAQDLPLTTSGKIDYFSIQKNVMNDQNDVFFRGRHEDKRQDSDSSFLIGYFKRFFPNQSIPLNVKIIDLGLESIDYLNMAEAFFKNTGKWLEVSKISDDVTISNIESCLVDPNVDYPYEAHSVQIDPIFKRFYWHELSSPIDSQPVFCFMSSFCLKGDIDLKRLETAIADTLSNHFMLSCKIVRRNDEYFFVQANRQSNFRLRRAFFISKKEFEQLKTSVHSENLVRIYIQKRWNRRYLVIFFHHIAIDGWSVMLTREEIFRRYEGTYNAPCLKLEEEIHSINCMHQVKAHIQDRNALMERLSYIDPLEYMNQLYMLSIKPLEQKQTLFSIEKDKVDGFAQKNQLQEFPYSVIFILLLHQIISNQFSVNKLYFRLTFSNRNLPVLGIKTLITNIASVLPLFLDSTHYSTQEFAYHIQDLLTVYFKNMSQGSYINEWLQEMIRPLGTKHNYIGFTYYNKIVDDEYSQNKYIDWEHSIFNPCFLRMINGPLLVVHNMGTHFDVILYSRMSKGSHAILTDNIKDALSVSTQQTQGVMSSSNELIGK